MFPSLSRPVIFAHRGASASAPENTLPAFDLAAQQGAKAIELDVQLTADLEVVVIHDLTLDRTTDGSGRVRDHSLAELKQLIVSSPDLSLSPAAEIPTLKEVLDRLPSEILINVELKNLATPFDSLAEITAEQISSSQAQRRVLISSFNPHSLGQFRRILPDVPLGRLLYSPLMIQAYQLLPCLTKNFQSIHLPYHSLSRDLVDTFQQRGLWVFAYTVNRPQDILRTIELGADGFFTDRPHTAFELLQDFPLQ